ncbi:MAG: epimerase [Saprospiraceae bacterium]|nr:epimerase [Candidatus Opimibacter iunctus]
MNLKVIITGSTGMVGKGVLLECFDSPDVENILIINRSPVGISHPKLKEIIHKDFFDWSAIRGELSGYNACYFCMGVSSVGMKEPDYTRKTYDLTLGFARELLPLNPNMTFCYVSGAGTDSTEKGRSMWARVKGKTENDLMALGFKDAYMFRPGFIEPMKGIKSKTLLYQGIYNVISPLYGLLRRMPRYVTTTVIIGKAMIGVAMHGYKTNVLESLDINSFK